MEKIERILELAQELQDSGDKLYNKNVKKYSTETRKQLMEITKLCKECRTEAQDYKNNMPKKVAAKGGKQAKQEKNDDSENDLSEGDSEDLDEVDKDEVEVAKVEKKKVHHQKQKNQLLKKVLNQLKQKKRKIILIDT